MPLNEILCYNNPNRRFRHLYVYTFNLILIGIHTCCPTISLSGAKREFLNGVYVQNGTISHNRPVYVHTRGLKLAIGFYNNNWMVFLDVLFDGEYSMYLRAGIKDCPSNVTIWLETYDGKFGPNYDFDIECIGKISFC